MTVDTFKEYVINSEKYKKCFINYFPDLDINELPNSGSFKIYYKFIRNKTDHHYNMDNFTVNIWNPYFQWFILGKEYS